MPDADQALQWFAGANLLVLLAWLVLSGLRSGHDRAALLLLVELQEMRLRDPEGDPERDREFTVHADELQARIETARARGPLVARRDLLAAQGDLVGLCARYPERAP